MSTNVSNIGFVTSFREFSKNSSIRQEALKLQQPILIEDERKKDFFFLVPQKMYKKLAEKYQEWCDAEEIKETMKTAKPEDFTDWSALKKELI